MILAGVASGTKGSDDFAFVEKPTALSKFLPDTLGNRCLLCAGRKRREPWVCDDDL